MMLMTSMTPLETADPTEVKLKVIFSPFVNFLHCQSATGRSSVLHFEPNLAEDLCFVPTHQLASVSTSVSPTVHQSGPINPFSEHCGHNFSPPCHPAIINKVPTCFLSQRALFQKIIWGNPGCPRKFIQNKTKRWQLVFGEIFPLSFSDLSYRCFNVFTFTFRVFVTCCIVFAFIFCLFLASFNFSLSLSICL